VLFHRQVPHVPGMGAMLGQYFSLLRRGCQAIPRHSNTVSITADISGEVKRRFHPGDKTEAFTRRLR